MHYYSQHGEDFILDLLFKNKSNGFFVEVGCIDGRRFSNTLFFEEKGWKGICIEPHLDYIELIKKNRPNSIVVPCAAGEKDEGEVIFYANARGSLSSLDASTEERWRRDYAPYFSGFKEQKVAKKMLTTIFKENNVKQINILSVDVEGYELEVLSGLDLNLFKPEVIVTEFDNKQQKDYLEKNLFEYGYYFLLEWGGNLFYSLNKEHKRVTLNKKFNDIHLIHTAHPLDNTVDEHKKIFIDLSGNKQQESILKKLKRKIFNNKKLFFVPHQKQNSRELSPFFDIGFHGDKYLLKVVDAIATKSQNFVETGANVGSTLSFFSKKFPNIECFSCEPDKDAFLLAQQNASGKNVHLFNETSQEFINRLQKIYSEIHSQPTIFWLDAHGYGFDWPLISEMIYILSKYKTFYIFIDDFEVPGVPEFGYDIYQNQICSHAYLKNHLPQKNFFLYYPAYKEKSSIHHPLRGWGLYSSEKIDWEQQGINFIREELFEK